MSRGELFVFEGPDGVGKSTLAIELAAQLRRSGHVVKLLASPGRTPGSLGRLVWEFHHDPEKFGVEKVHPTSLQLLHVAAHVDMIEEAIRPAIQRGECVVLDRFWWSTLVYGTEDGVLPAVLQNMVELEQHHWEDLRPTQVFLVSRDEPLRREHSLERFEALKRAYLVLASKEPNVVVVENRGTISETLATVWRLVAERMPAVHSSPI